MAEAAELTERENVDKGGEESQAQPTLREYAESLFVTIVLALFATTFIVQAFKIPSQSMEPTLLVGDHLLVNKFIFGGRGGWYERLLPYRPVRRGDIIVFKFPFDDHPHYVKRVIGVPGDHIKIVNAKIYINGKLSSEAYVVHDEASEDPYADNFPPSDRYFLNGSVRQEWAHEILNYVQKGELVVPADHYFVMGDNRDHSWDSRYWGFVDREAIMGRPVLIYWSVEATSADYGDRGIGGNLIALVDFIVHLPSRTRWSRML
ncbi:MAG: signal peptidase I, partial [Candidatus Acidiferrales bacterium]